VDRRELARGEGLEDERRVARRRERALGLECHRRGREREELVRGRPLELLAAEKGVAEPGQDCDVSWAGSSVGGASSAGASTAGAASVVAAISFGASPLPTSALSFASSLSTWFDAESCESSFVSWSPPVKSSSAPLVVSSSIAPARACISSVLSFARWMA